MTEIFRVTVWHQPDFNYGAVSDDMFYETAFKNLEDIGS